MKPFVPILILIPSRYLIEKKLEKEREQKKILEEAERTGVLDPDCPPGHILLPTEKRLEQLEFLKKSKYDILVMSSLRRFEKNFVTQIF